MKPFTIHLKIFTCLLLISQLAAKAQIISSEKGLTTAEFILSEGKIKIYLPEDIRQGDHISGTVVMEAAGNTEKEKSRNIQSLQKYQLGHADGSFGKQGLSGLFNYTLKGPNTNFTLSANGKIISSLMIPLKSNIATRTNLSIPTHALTASPLPMKGQFDGNAENTKCMIDGRHIEILAESPRQCIVQLPQVTSGAHNILISENNKTTEQKICAVNLDVNAGRLNLQKGESTYIDVIITGLQNLPSAATLSVVNTSTATVMMTGGDAQVIHIQPATVSEAGSFTKRFDLKSVKTGNFSVNVNLDLPEPASATGNAASLCNCYINEQSCLIPLQTCLALGGSTNPPVFYNTSPDNQNPKISNPPPAILLSPGNINAQTYQVTLQVNVLNDDVAAVIFSEKPVSGTEWQQAGRASFNGASWSANWLPPLGNDGQHIIRARVAGKNSTITELYTGVYLQLTPATIKTMPGERVNFTVTDAQLSNANQNVQQQVENLWRIQEKLARLRRKLEELIEEMDRNKTMADELAAIDKTIEKIPGLYADSLKKLTDSLAKLRAALPPNPDPADLQKTADEASQRAKDCEDRLNKLKQEKENAQQELNNLNNEIENLLKQLDALHLGNNWSGGHGYHKDGSFWYGYVGDENSNTNIWGESNAISGKLKALRKPQNAAKNRIKALDAEIAKAQEECDKLKKEKDKAEDAAKKGNAMAAAETQIDELCRQIQALLDALKKWCAAHPGVCHFNPELPGKPRTVAELEAFLSQLDDIINKKKQKEADLEKTADEKASEAQGVGNDIKAAEEEMKAAEEEMKKAQAAADKLQAEREKQLEEERAKKRKEEEEQAKNSAPKPAPTLPEPIDASDKQIKFQALSMLRSLYRDYWVDKGPCDCTTKAIALANNTNTAASDVLGGLAIGIIFAPIESLPGLSFAAKLGIGAAKALGSALYGGESFTDELAKNLFDVIGGEIFPGLLDSETAGNAANKFAGKGLEEFMKAEGIRSTQWEGETTLRECGKVKGKTTMLFNPNTGWVTLLIKIDNCPLIVIKYKVNKDGVPITKPSVTKVQ